MTVFEGIVSAINGLRSCTDIEIVRSAAHLVDDFGEAGASLKRLVATVSDVKCPNEILPGLQIDTELSLYWRHKSGNRRGVIGEFVLPSPMVFMLESRLSDVFFDEPYDGVDLRRTRTIDYSGYTAKGIHALLEVKNGRVIDDVLIFDERQIYRMKVTYLEYMELVRRTRGIKFWQLLFCDDSDPASPRLDHVERGLDLLTAEFPQEEFSDLRKRLQQMRG